MSDIIGKINLKFSSGNDVPITSAFITDVEWSKVRDEIDRLRAELDALRKQEPVAFTAIRKQDGVLLDFSQSKDTLIYNGWVESELLPLYSAPVQPAAVADAVAVHMEHSALPSTCKNCGRKLAWSAPGNGSCPAPMCDRPTFVVTPMPVPPAAVAVPEGWRVNDDGHRITVCWDGIGYTLDDRHGLVQEAFCGFVRDVVKSAATPAPVAPKVVLGLGDAIELTKSYRDEFAETGETLLSNGQARRFADALTLVLYAVNGEK